MDYCVENSLFIVYVYGLASNRPIFQTDLVCAPKSQSADRTLYSTGSPREIFRSAIIQPNRAKGV